MRLGGSTRVSLIDRGDVDDRASDDGATAAGATAEHAKGCRCGRSAARSAASHEVGPDRRAPRVEAAGAIAGVAARARAADLGRPGGDQSRAARGRLVHRDRGQAGQGGLDRVPGGGRQRRPRRLPGLAGAPAGSRPGPRPEDVEAELCPARGPGHPVAAGVVVAAGDRRPVADGVRRRSDDAGEPRDDLPGPVRAGPRRAASRAGPLPAHRTGQAAAAATAGRTPASSGTWS